MTASRRSRASRLQILRRLSLGDACQLPAMFRQKPAHAFGIAFPLRPGQGEDQRRAPRPQMRVFDPGFDGVEPAGVGQQAARRGGRRIIRDRPAVEIAQTLGHEAPDFCLGLDRFPRQDPRRDDLEVLHWLAPQAPAELERLLLRQVAERLPDRDVHLRQRDAPMLPARFLVALFLLRPLGVAERAQGLQEAGLGGVEDIVGHDDDSVHKAPCGRSRR